MLASEEDSCLVIATVDTASEGDDCLVIAIVNTGHIDAMNPTWPQCIVNIDNVVNV